MEATTHLPPAVSGQRRCGGALRVQVEREPLHARSHAACLGLRGRWAEEGWGALGVSCTSIQSDSLTVQACAAERRLLPSFCQLCRL